MMVSKSVLLILFSLAPIASGFRRYYPNPSSSESEIVVCADADLTVDSLTVGTFPTYLASEFGGGPPIFTMVTADVYSCATRVDAPLLIVIPGADARKTEYSMLAKAFLNRGYTVAVLEEPIDPGPFSTLAFVNLASSRALKFFIDLAVSLDAQGEFPANTDEIILLGHSFGGSAVLTYLQGICPTPLCIPNIPGSSVFVPAPQVKAAGAFGTSLIRRNTTDDTISWNEGLDNTGFPFFIINGDYDQRNFDSIDGEPVVDGTFSRLTPIKAFASMEGLDHYSIVDRLIPAGAAFNNFQDSPEPREFQLKAAVTALDYWFEKALTEDYANICDDLVQETSAAGYSVVRCLETV
jgi:hypothetical protein